MSDNYTILIPDSPDFVPAEDSQQKAVEFFRSIAPNADKINVETFDSIQFFDCGGNFERILCPDCASEIDIGWWQKQMDEDFESGFRLRPLEVPCCQKPKNLSELIYQWPQGFARFSLSAMNTNAGDLTEDQKRQFEQILGCRLKKILQHL